MKITIIRRKFQAVLLAALALAMGEPPIQAIENHVKVSAALGAEANWTKATCTAEIRDGAALLTIQKPGADRGFMMIEMQPCK